MKFETKILLTKHVKNAIDEARNQIETCGSLTAAEAKIGPSQKHYFESVALEYQEIVKELQDHIQGLG